MELELPPNTAGPIAHVVHGVGEAILADAHGVMFLEGDTYKFRVRIQEHPYNYVVTIKREARSADADRGRGE